MIDVPLQTNRLYIYRIIDGKHERTEYRVLNARKTSHSLSFTTNAKVVDTDNDLLSDEDELIYRTDPLKADTDEDGYIDGVEINKSWDPLSSGLSPGQQPFDKDDASMNVLEPPPFSPSAQAVKLSEDTGVWGSAMFTRVLQDIRMYVDREVESKTIWLLLLSVGIL
jgi:hypothetical protein